MKKLGAVFFPLGRFSAPGSVRDAVSITGSAPPQRGSLWRKWGLGVVACVGVAGCSGLPTGPYVPSSQVSDRTPMRITTTTTALLQCMGNSIDRHATGRILFLVGGVNDATIPLTATSSSALSNLGGRAFIMRALSAISSRTHQIMVMDIHPSQFLAQAQKQGPAWIAQLGVQHVYTLDGGYTENDRLVSKGLGGGAQYEGSKVGGQGSVDASSSIDRIAIDLSLTDTLTHRMLKSVGARIESYKDNRSFKLSFAGEEWGLGIGASNYVSEGLHAQQRVVTEFATLLLLGYAYQVPVERCWNGLANRDAQPAPRPTPAALPDPRDPFLRPVPAEVPTADLLPPEQGDAASDRDESAVPEASYSRPLRSRAVVNTYRRYPQPGYRRQGDWPRWPRRYRRLWRYR